MKPSFIVTVEDLENVRNTRAQRVRQFKGIEKFSNGESAQNFNAGKKFIKRCGEYLTSDDEGSRGNIRNIVFIERLTENEINDSWKRVFRKRAEQL